MFTINIYNLYYFRGHVPSKWSVECKKKQAYFVCPSKGELLPGEKSILDVYFMPIVKNVCPGELNIYIEGNPNETLIELCGYGSGPNLVFNYTNLKFRTALPYTKDSTTFFFVQNVSSTPTEFCFADFNQ